MAATGSDDDDAFGSFDDDDFGSFGDGDATGTEADADQPAHDVTETAESANNNNNHTEDKAVVDGGSLLPPRDTTSDLDADADAGIPVDNNSAAENAAGGDESVDPSSEEPPAPPSDIPPELEEESDTPLAMPSQSQSPPPEIPSSEEAMESADETAIAPEATTAPLPERALTSDAPDATAGMDGTVNAAPAMMTSPPPIGASGGSADDHEDDPFASLGGATDAPLPVLSGSADADEGFGDFGGFGDMSGAYDAAPNSGDGGADADADIDTSIPKDESGAEGNQIEALGPDSPIAEPENETTPDPADDDGIDVLGAFPSEKERDTCEAEDTHMDADDADAIGVTDEAATPTESPSAAPVANPPLDQLSSFVTAATEDEEAVVGTEDASPSAEDQNDDDDEEEDGFGGFEDAASEEEEKKDGSPIADKMPMPAISDAVDGTSNAIPPALPLESAEDIAPADSFGAFDDGAATGDGNDQEKDVPKAESDENGGIGEATDATQFGMFGNNSISAEVPTPISDESPDDEALQTQGMDAGENETEDIATGEDNGDKSVLETAVVDTGNENATEKVELPPPESNTFEMNAEDGFDAFAGASSPAPVDAENNEGNYVGDDDGFDAFAEVPAVTEQKPTEFVGDASPSNGDVSANDLPESPDECLPDPVESTENDSDAFEEAPVAAAPITDGSDPAKPCEDGKERSKDDGFDAFAEAPAASSSPERVEAMDDQEEDDDDDEFGDFDAFTEAPASSSPVGDTHPVDEFDVPAPVPTNAPESNEEKAGEDDAEVEQQQQEEDDDDDDDESDDDFGDFGDFGGVSEAKAPEETNVADIPAETETHQQETVAVPPEEDSDDEDDDFGDFGDFDEAPAPDPAAATGPISAPTAPIAEVTQGGDEEFATSFEEQAATPSASSSTQAGSDPIIQQATVVCKGMFQQYASSLPDEGLEEDKETESIPVQSILDSILAGEDSGPTLAPSSSLSSKKKIEEIFSETEIERAPAKLIMNYDMPKPYAQYAADSGTDLKTDRGLSLEASSHSNDGDVFVPEVLSIDLPKETELSPEPQVPKLQVQPSAEFVDFPMSATRVVIPDKKEVADAHGGFANFGDSSETPAEAATQTVAEPEIAVDKFLAKIPDLSFMLSKELVLPK